MIRLEVTLENIANEASELIRAFYPKQVVDISPLPQQTEYDMKMSCIWDENSWSTTLVCAEKTICQTKYVGEMLCDEDEILYKRRVKGALKETVYYALKEHTGRSLPYGMLTGVRPLAISGRLLEEYSYDETVDHLIEEYDISNEKAHLLATTSKVQTEYAPNEDDVSLYIHVPFCTTRCNYCSFPSELVDKVKPHLNSYMEALAKETSFITDNAKGNFEAMYVGGGTPTALPHDNFERLCEICLDAKAKKNISEFTLEAGRPDTIDEAKLKMMKCAGVTRISINPQTMNDATLERIGRKHTSDDIIKTFELARKIGFDNINMDLIVGLSGESTADVKRTIDRVLELEPEGITVHVLALKHASVLNRDGVDIFGSMDGIEELIASEYKELDNRGYIPYYLYRQKYMLGGLENVGFAKKGMGCRYNIRMMDNLSTCWAAGAGSISKRCYLKDTRIERAANPKNAVDYISGLEECLKKKLEIMD